MATGLYEQEVRTRGWGRYNGRSRYRYRGGGDYNKTGVSSVLPWLGLYTEVCHCFSCLRVSIGFGLPFHTPTQLPPLSNYYTNITNLNPFIILHVALAINSPHPGYLTLVNLGYINLSLSLNPNYPGLHYYPWRTRDQGDIRRPGMGYYFKHFLFYFFIFIFIFISISIFIFIFFLGGGGYKDGKAIGLSHFYVSNPFILFKTCRAPSLKIIIFHHLPL